MSETPRWLNLMPYVPLDLMVLNSPDNAMGPGPGHSRHFVHQRYEGVASCASKSQWVKRWEPNCTPSVPFRWTTETAPRYCGPTFAHFRCFGVWGFEMHKDIKPSPFELATVEKTMRVDLMPRILWIEGYYSSLHTIWA
jgi:hypothetical protein